MGKKVENLRPSFPFHSSLAPSSLQLPPSFPPLLSSFLGWSCFTCIYGLLPFSCLLLDPPPPSFSPDPRRRGRKEGGGEGGSPAYRFQKRWATFHGESRTLFRPFRRNLHCKLTFLCFEKKGAFCATCTRVPIQDLGKCLPSPKDF